MAGTLEGMQAQALWHALFTAFLGALLAAPAPKPAGFSFEAASGVSNRQLTPNGDGLNDFIVFSFTNSRDSEVRGTVYDLHGKRVADLTPGPVAATTLLWDGKSGGTAVRGGVYIYVLFAENTAYAGTVMVIR